MLAKQTEPWNIGNHVRTAWKNLTLLQILNLSIITTPHTMSIISPITLVSEGWYLIHLRVVAGLGYLIGIQRCELVNKFFPGRILPRFFCTWPKIFLDFSISDQKFQGFPMRNYITWLFLSHLLHDCQRKFLPLKYITLIKQWLWLFLGKSRD